SRTAPAIPNRSATRVKSAGSPRGSAAATSNNRWVFSGRASSRRRKLCSSLDRQRSRQPEPAGQLRGRKPAWELEQRQRVTARLGDELVGDAVVQPARDHRRQQLLRLTIVEPLDEQLRQPRERIGRLARGEQE